MKWCNLEWSHGLPLSAWNLQPSCPKRYALYRGGMWVWTLEYFQPTATVPVSYTSIIKSKITDKAPSTANYREILQE